MTPEQTPLEIIDAIRRDVAAGYDGIGADQVRVLLDAYDAALADVRRMDFIERYRWRVAPDGMDGWIARGPLTQMGMRQGYPRHGAHRLREAIDAASSPEEATEAGR